MESNQEYIWILYTNHVGKPGRVMSIFDSYYSAMAFVEKADKVPQHRWRMSKIADNIWLCFDLPARSPERVNHPECFYYSIERSRVKTMQSIEAEP